MVIQYYVPKTMEIEHNCEGFSTNHNVDIVDFIGHPTDRAMMSRALLGSTTGIWCRGVKYLLRSVWTNRNGEQFDGDRLRNNMEWPIYSDWKLIKHVDV